jgi:hypothetical protein
LTDPHHERRWLILGVISIAQLLVVLDVTIVNIALLAVATAGAGIFGMFLFLTFYLQSTKGWTALETGLAFMPMNIAIIATATTVSTRVLARTGPRPLVPAGMLSAALGMVLLTRIGVDTAYASHVLPSLLLVGLGSGLIIAPSIATATLGVSPRDSCVASAMVNTSQQVGGSIGTALLSTLAASATTDFVTEHGPAAEVLRQAAVEGYVTAFWWAAGIFALGALMTGSLLRSGVRPAMAHRAAAEPAVARRGGAASPAAVGVGSVALSVKSTSEVIRRNASSLALTASARRRSGGSQSSPCARRGDRVLSTRRNGGRRGLQHVGAEVPQEAGRHRPAGDRARGARAAGGR